MSENTGEVAKKVPEQRTLRDRVSDTLDAVVNTTQLPVKGVALAAFLEQGVYHIKPDALMLMGSHTVADLVLFSADMALFSVVRNFAHGRGVQLGRGHFKERAKSLVGVWNTGHQGLEHIAAPMESPAVQSAESATVRERVSALARSWRGRASNHYNEKQSVVLSSPLPHPEDA